MKIFIREIFRVLHLDVVYRTASLASNVLLCRFRYMRIRRRLRKRAPDTKIRVLFIVDSTSKWKCQSLYDLMKFSPIFEPVMGLTLQARDLGNSSGEICKKLTSDRQFYERHGNRCVDLVDPDTHRPVLPDEKLADIVFFQEPWGTLPGQDVGSISRTALTCYVPYSIESPVEALKYCHGDFQRLVYLEFMWSEARGRYYRPNFHWWNRAGAMPGTGHPTLDYFYLNQDKPMTGDAVIYAPHYSFNHPNHHPFIHLSTFSETGAAILKYAQEHPEINWCYKPHPILYHDLVACGAMTETEVAAYDAAWNAIATTCYDGDYQELFVKSRALITDCGSFLFEYTATGNPVLRLIPANVNTFPCPAAQPICEAFYNIHNLEEMYATFDQVIVRREDPKRESRLARARQCELIGNYAAKKIMRYLQKEVG